jgi:HAD superfamily hydrolase (TIGR01509 family)
MHRFQAVIFDMDGLLLDTERIALAAFLDTCDHFGIDRLRDVFVRCIGINQRLGEEVLRDGLKGRVDHMQFEEVWNANYIAATSNQPVPVKDGAIELLAHLAALSIPVGVATSTGSERAAQKLRDAGMLERVAVLVGGDQVPNSKPYPDVYLKAAELLGAAPRACLALEDSENGVRSALGAGMTVVQIPDLVEPSPELRSLGHIILGSLRDVAHYPFRTVL